MPALLVTHGHFNVNGRRTDVPSMLVRPGDLIEVRAGSRTRPYFKESGGRWPRARTVPRWLERDLKSAGGHGAPDRRNDRTSTPA